jgi:hypothetical protein
MWKKFMAPPEVLYAVYETSYRLPHHQAMTHCYTIKVTRFYFQSSVGTEIPTADISLNRKNISSIWLCTQGLIYLQRCFRQTIRAIKWEGEGKP